MPGCAGPSAGSASPQAGAKNRPRNQPERRSQLFCCSATKSLDEANPGGNIALIVQCSKNARGALWSSLFPTVELTHGECKYDDQQERVFCRHQGDGRFTG